MARGSVWVATVIFCLGGRPAGARSLDPSYFPLHVGNWWTYEELDDDGTPLSHETWTLVGGKATARTGEYRLHSLATRLDGIGVFGRQFENTEYVRVASDGVRKRFLGRSAAYDVLLLKQPARFGTRWHDAQGSCQLTAEEEHCDGPSGNVDDCLEVVCRLGRGQTLVITSTYARGVGMVRQRLDLVRFLPVTSAGRYPTLPNEIVDVHSVLRLAAYRVVGSIGRRRTSHPETRHRHRPGGDAWDRLREPVTRGLQ